ncbi:MAG TPA: DUF2723 domain-containing protein [Chloroflexia bacterium]|nr:DUF2723 domain-containing protein [Chloroflexia bacterium]
MLARLKAEPRRAAWIAAAVLSLIWFVVYLTTVSPTVNFIDSGELITVLYEPGVAHPPGYPLYTLLGYVASRLPIGEIAWRVNAMSAFWGALAVGAFFLLIFRSALFVQPRLTGRVGAPRPRRGRSPSRSAAAAPTAPPAPGRAREWLFLASAAAGASLLAASSTFWSRTAQAKMYSLHFFLVAVLFLLALAARQAYDRGEGRLAARLLVALAAVLGLSFTNHLMTVLVVLPLALLFLAGARLGERFMFIVRRLHVIAPGFLLPLLIYLYMPLRAAQNPVMNWGSTDNWGDFWRHVTGWQFRTYLAGDIPANISRNSGILAGYASEQWSFLTILVVLAALAGAILVARTSLPLFASTVTFAAITLAFDLVYGISEIEPYAVPLYMMLCLWAGLIPAAWVALGARAGRAPALGDGPMLAESQGRVAAGVLAAVALLSAVLVYPRQNYSNNRLAEQFVLNAFSEMPSNSIVITEYWDFYAPTYYLQMLQGVRPDIVLIDKSLLRYPWYTGQLRQRYPWLIDRSQDIVDRFSAEQRRWVNGEPYDEEAINFGYLDLLSSFVERNYPEYTPYVLWLQDCPPNVQCEANLIAPDWTRQPTGLAYRLWPPGAQLELPPEPEYELRGITSEPVAFDTFARVNSEMYRQAYLRLADLYARSGRIDAEQRMSDRARELAVALQGR